MASVARLRDLMDKIQKGQSLTESEAYEFFNFSMEEVPSPNDIPPDVQRVLRLMQRMQNEPALTQADINEALQLRRDRFTTKIYRHVFTLPFGEAIRRRHQTSVYEAIRAVVMAASNDEEPGVVEERAILAAQGALAAREAVPAGRRVDCMQVHRVSAEFKEKLPLVAVAIRNDLSKARGDLSEDPQYPSFIEHLDATIGNCVRNSSLFESKMKPNSKQVRSRQEWLSDYDRVKARLTSALISMPPDLIQLLGDILDFVFKHLLEECYVSNFLYDTAHAYEGEGRENESSCPAGATERVYTTLFNCIKGKNDGVFGELNRILEGEQATLWKQLDKATQIAYGKEFDNFVMEWAQDNKDNDEVKKMTGAQRNEAVLAAFKARPDHPPLPPMVEGFIRDERFKGLTFLWPDIGFNSPNPDNAGGGGVREGGGGGVREGGGATGGRRTRHKKKRNRKTHRKNKKSLRRR